jgi:hypothetical protein
VKLRDKPTSKADVRSELMVGTKRATQEESSGAITLVDYWMAGHCLRRPSLKRVTLLPVLRPGRKTLAR